MRLQVGKSERSGANRLGVVAIFVGLLRCDKKSERSGANRLEVVAVLAKMLQGDIDRV